MPLPPHVTEPHLKEILTYHLQMHIGLGPACPLPGAAAEDVEGSSAESFQDQAATAECL